MCHFVIKTGWSELLIGFFPLFFAFLDGTVDLGKQITNKCKLHRQSKLDLFFFFRFWGDILTRFRLTFLFSFFFVFKLIRFRNRFNFDCATRKATKNQIYILIINFVFPATQNTKIYALIFVECVVYLAHGTQSSIGHSLVSSIKLIFISVAVFTYSL